MSKTANNPLSAAIVFKTTKEPYATTIQQLNFINDSTLETLTEPLIDLIKDGMIHAAAGSDMQLRRMVDAIAQKKWRFDLSELPKLFHGFTGTLFNIYSLAQAWPDYKRLWLHILQDYESTSASISKFLGRRPQAKVSFYYSNRCTVEPLLFPLKVSNYSWNYDRNLREIYNYTFRIDPILRKMLVLDFMGRAALDATVLPELPEDSKLSIENFEARLTADLATLSAYALTGSALATTGVVKDSAMQKIRSLLPNAEFNQFIGRQSQPDRQLMLANTYFTCRDNSSHVTPANLAKYTLFELPLALEGKQFAMFFPNLTGFTKQWIRGTYAVALTDEIKALLLPAADGWMSTANFRLRLLCSDSPTPHQFHLQLFDTDSIQRSRLEFIRPSGIKRSPTDWFNEVGFVFAVNWINLLCAIGLLELAVDINADEKDPMQGIRFIRMTDLGRYAFGLTNKYVAPEAPESENNDIDFDPLNAIITLNSPNSPYQPFLAQTCRKISATRFKLLPESLIAGCSTADELDVKINNLSLILSPQKYPEIKAIFDAARAHTDCATFAGSYSVITIRPDLADLRQLILTDTELRALVTLAEGGLLVIKSSDKPLFQQLCARRGYIL